MSEQADESDYVAVVTRGGEGEAVIHRRECSHVRRAVSPMHWVPDDQREGDRACSKCLPDGVLAAEANRLLEPWAERLSAVMVGLDNHCEGLTDEELNAFTAAVRWPSPSNCWWATYRAALIARDSAASEIQKRVSRTGAAA